MDFELGELALGFWSAVRRAAVELQLRVAVGMVSRKASNRGLWVMGRVAAKDHLPLLARRALPVAKSRIAGEVMAAE